MVYKRSLNLFFRKILYKGPGKAFSVPADLQLLSEVKRLANEIEKREGSKFTMFQTKKKKTLKYTFYTFINIYYIYIYISIYRATCFN